MNNGRELVRVENLKTHFSNIEGLLRAVDDVSFSIYEGESLGIVGESGCGKSVTAQSVMNLLPKQNAKIAGGHIYFMGDPDQRVEITALDSDSKIMRSIRGDEIAMVFQEPMTSLSPVYTIGAQIIETIMHHGKAEDKKEAREQAIRLLERVGISAPAQRVDSYPFELSGGMRQRAMIAMALSCNPRLLIADEPTTALDVTVEAQILALIKDLQQEFGMALMIITHDLGVIGETADRVIVMYMGKIVEHGSVDNIFYDPQHPYTRGLLRSLPVIGQKRRLTPIGGSVPNPYLIPKTCAFLPRCIEAGPMCMRSDTDLVEVAPGHFVRCGRVTGENLHHHRGDANEQPAGSL